MDNILEQNFEAIKNGTFPISDDVYGLLLESGQFVKAKDNLIV